MTISREEIIRMAREAGFRVGPSRDGPDDVWGVGVNLERFAALVAAVVVPKTALAEGYKSGYEAGVKEITRDVETMLVGLLNDAISQEREACAQAAEECLTRGRSPLGRQVAEAIRARSEK